MCFCPLSKEMFFGQISRDVTNFYNFEALISLEQCENNVEKLSYSLIIVFTAHITTHNIYSTCELNSFRQTLHRHFLLKTNFVDLCF